ncbi:MAG TPA: NAD(P)/FAD-dependent oxidoreductase, partial [Anaerolinea sp.]|nr:NAD(P)/FAD-dependent oxidoreductase [Anaerolinea sp.]
VRGVDLDARIVETSVGRVEYDYLVVAAGGVTNFFGMESVERRGLGLKGAPDADAIRNHLLELCEQALYERNPQGRRKLLTFVVAGGGPTGVESAGAMAELVRNGLPRDYPGLDWGEARVILLEAAGRLLPAMPESLGDYTLRTLRAKGVEVRFNAGMTGFDGSRITLKEGEPIETNTLIWAAGVKASPLEAGLPLEKGAQGRVKVLPTLQVPGHPEAFVIGDAAFLPDEDGKPLPMVAPVAMQQGVQAARNLLRQMNGKPLEDFHYHDPGTMATIGRSQAVAWIGPLRLRGLIAWLAWVVVHIYQLVGFRNRLMVLLDWAWNYIVYDRPVRMINRVSHDRTGNVHHFSG